jgi:hypothetical protein
MKNGNRMPTTTVSQHRVQLFQPTQRPIYRTAEKTETSWGSCKVTGRLGQRHADLLEAVFWVAEKQRPTEDGGIELLVDPAKLRRTLSDGGSCMKRITQWFAELRAAAIEIETPRLVRSGVPCIGGLIVSVEPSPATRKNPFGGIRHLMRIRIDKALVFLMENDVPIYRDPSPIARLSCGISQAIARHVLSHRPNSKNGWSIDSLIFLVGGAKPGDSISIRHRRSELKKDALALRKIGIYIEEGKMKTCSTAPMVNSTAPA